jgi:hypothetical protein
MITTPSMGLKRWDQPNDVFSYTELSDNFNLLDAHDHSSGKGVQVPTGGIANLAVTGPKVAADAIDASKIAANAVGTTEIVDGSVTGGKLAAGSVTNANLAGGITDAKLASPNNAAWRPVFHDVVTINAGANTAAGIYSWNNGGIILNNITNDTRLMKMWYPITADVAVAGLTTKIRIRIVAAGNSLSTGVTYTVKLYPVTSIGSGSNVLNLQLLDAPKVTAPALTITPGWWPSVSTAVTLGTISDQHAFGVVTSAATPANAVVNINAYLEMQHV